MKIIQDDGTVDRTTTRYWMKDAKYVATPTDSSIKLVKANDEINQGMYQSAVGSLLYLSTGTRPNITFAVSNVAKFFSSSIGQLLSKLLDILRVQLILSS